MNNIMDMLAANSLIQDTLAEMYQTVPATILTESDKRDLQILKLEDSETKRGRTKKDLPELKEKGQPKAKQNLKSFFVSLMKLNRYVEGQRLKTIVGYDRIWIGQYTDEEAIAREHAHIDRRLGESAGTFDIGGSGASAADEVNFMQTINEFFATDFVVKQRPDKGFDIGWAANTKDNLSVFLGINNTFSDKLNIGKGRGRRGGTADFYPESARNVGNIEAAIKRNINYSQGLYSDFLDDILKKQADLEEKVRPAIDAISKLFSIDLATNTKNKIEVRVPLSFDFSTLFTTQLNVEGIESVIPRLPDEVNVYSNMMELSVMLVRQHVRARAPRESLSKLQYSEKVIPLSPVYGLFAYNIVITPVFKFSKTLCQYITQSEDPDITAFYFWAKIWVDLIFSANGRMFSNRKSRNQMALPDFIPPISKISVGGQKREAAGLRNTTTRSDQSGMSVTADGKFAYVPDANYVDNTAAIEFETKLKRMLEVSSQLNVALNMERTDIDDSDDPELEKELKELKRDVKSLGSSPLLVDWNTNSVITVSASMESKLPITVTPLEGASSPRKLAVPGALLTNFDDAMILFMKRFRGQDGERIDYFSRHAPMPLPMDCISRTYAYLRKHNKVRDIDYYVKIAAKQLGKENGIHEDDFEFVVLEKYMIGMDIPVFDANGLNFLSMAKFLGQAAPEQSKQKQLADQSESRVSLSLNLDDMRSNNMNIGQVQVLQEFGIVNEWNNQKWDGNRDILFWYGSFDYLTKVWRRLTESMSDGTFRSWFKYYVNKELAKNPDFIMEPDDVPFYFNPNEHNLARMAALNDLVYGLAYTLALKDLGQVVNAKDSLILRHDPEAKKPVIGGIPFVPHFDTLMDDVMPFIKIVSDYVHGADEYKKLYDDETKRIDPANKNENVPSIPCAKNLMLLPHQKRAFQTLQNVPELAILGFEPGGGKTITGLTDIIMLMGKGSVKKPLVMAPSRLIKEWVSEISRYWGECFNTFVVDSATYSRMTKPNGIGEEKLIDLLKNAPPNTIFFTSFSFINQEQATVVGPVVRYIYPKVEFLRLIGFDCVLIDESHKLKGKSASGGVESKQSRAAIQLTLDPNVKFVRLCTGTFISNKLGDVVGQSRIMDPTVFGSQNVFEAQYMADGAYVNDAGQLIRNRLNSRTAFLQGEKKDWAWLLPAPVETIYHVEMNKELRTIYDAILFKILEELKDSGLFDILRDIEDRSDGFDEDEEDDKGSERTYDDGVIGGDIDASEIDESNIEMTVNTFVCVRLEQFLHDPAGDSFAKQFIPEDIKEDVLREVLVPPKAAQVEKILRKHLNDPAEKGKVIVFCRNIRSMQAIYDFMPADIKQQCVPYYSGLKPNLPIWLNDPKIRVLIAVEQSVGTGYNFQIASRLIRTDIPWIPGDFEQSTARVFRPDVRGEFDRKFVYLDWIICNGSVEVVKFARIISKLLDSAAFTKHNNPLYTRVIRDVPKVIKVGLKNIQAIRDMSDIQDEYINKYESYRTVSLDEIDRERKRGLEIGIKNLVLEIPDGEPLPGSAKLEYSPFVDGQQIPDPNGWGLENFEKWLANSDAIKTDVKNQEHFAGLKVLTEFGPGVIKSVRVSKNDTISSVNVILAGTTSAKSFPAGIVYVASTVKPEDESKFTVRSPSTIKPVIAPDEEDIQWDENDMQVEPVTETEDVVEPEADVAQEQEDVEPETETEELLDATWYTTTDPLVILLDGSKTRVPADTLFGLAEQDGVKYFVHEDGSTSTINNKTNALLLENSVPYADSEDGVPDQQDVVPDVKPPNKVEAYVGHIGGTFALILNAADPDIKDLELPNAKKLDQYISINPHTLAQYQQLVKWITTTYKVSAANKQQLDSFATQFKGGLRGPNAKFVVEDSNHAQTMNFITGSHRKIVKDDEIEVYPYIENGDLHLVINYNNVAAARKLVNKRVPGTGPDGVWRLVPKSYWLFADNKLQLQKLLDNLGKQIEITDKDYLDHQMSLLVAKKKV